MVEPSRYRVSDKVAGIQNGVLANKLGIKNQKNLDDVETLLLADSYSHFFELLDKTKVKFDLSLLFSIHQYFFDPLYDWAGKTRIVNISKGEMFFIPVEFLDKALEEFARLLKTELSALPTSKADLSCKLAMIHNEFNVIHPFREGNGRTIRLFLDLLAVNFGYNPIDWGKESKAVYFEACVKGAIGDNKAMTRLIKNGLKK